MTQSKTKSDSTDQQNDKQPVFQRINHIALAVRDLEAAIELFQNKLGFELTRRRQKNDMLAADMNCNGIYFVLCQGMTPISEFSRIVNDHGIGLAHIALDVEDVDAAVTTLIKQGVEFETGIIREVGVTHAFSSRDEHTGLSVEVIRCGE